MNAEDDGPDTAGARSVDDENDSTGSERDGDGDGAGVVDQTDDGQPNPGSDAASGHANRTNGPADDARAGAQASEHAEPGSGDREMDAIRGWVLVGVLGFSMLGAPLLILWRPPGIPYWAALLALPMLPAILLGVVGVWATTRA